MDAEHAGRPEPVDDRAEQGGERLGPIAGHRNLVLPIPPGPIMTKETEGLKRNQFFVKVRCYGNYSVADAQPALAPPKPVLFELPTAVFWVQAAVTPYDFWARQPLPDVSRYFDLIDRVEVEFWYR